MALLLEAMDPLAPPRMVSPRREKKPRFSTGFSAVTCGTVGSSAFSCFKVSPPACQVCVLLVGAADGAAAGAVFAPVVCLFSSCFLLPLVQVFPVPVCFKVKAIIYSLLTKGQNRTA